MFLSGVATALTAMGGMALLLSIVGIYALLSFMVTRRTREIGIRVALGGAELAGVAIDHRRGHGVYLLIGGVIGTGLGIVFMELRSMILISIPTPGVWMPATIFLTLAIAGAVGVLGAGTTRAWHSPAEALQRRLIIHGLHGLHGFDLRRAHQTATTRSAGFAGARRVRRG